MTRKRISHISFNFILLCLILLSGCTGAVDGTNKIVFFSDRAGNDQIYVMDANGSNQTRLTNSTSANYYPTWSPDGSKIIFSSTINDNDDIYVMNADGTGLTQLTNDTAADGDPNWSPDGSKIAFISGRAGNLEIYISLQQSQFNFP